MDSIIGRIVNHLMFCEMVKPPDLSGFHVHGFISRTKERTRKPLQNYVIPSAVLIGISPDCIGVRENLSTRLDPCDQNASEFDCFHSAHQIKNDRPNLGEFMTCWIPN